MGLIEDLKAKADDQVLRWGRACQHGHTDGKYSAGAKCDAYLDAYNMAKTLHAQAARMIKLTVELSDACENFMKLLGGGETPERTIQRMKNEQIDITTASESDLESLNSPSPETIEELTGYIADLVAKDHDYGTCVYAMSLAAVAALNYVANVLGCTGFQASCADLDVIRRIRGLKGPIMLIDGSKLLYPQYNLQQELTEALEEWTGWAALEAQKLLDDPTSLAIPAVWDHWEKLAAKRRDDGTGRL